MGPVAKADLPIRFAVHSEFEGICEDLLVAIARWETQDNLIALEHLLTSNFVVMRGDTYELVDWGRPADGFLDEVLDQRKVGPDSL